MNPQSAACTLHGPQDMAIACIHVCRAIDSGERVGFFWDPGSDGPRPDAWCAACEQWARDHPEALTDEWIQAAQFKFLCVRCWDEAKARLT